MDANVNRADDYLGYVEGALEEARSQVTRASEVSVEEQVARQTLADTLGQAYNAITRAQRDLEAHRGRARRRDDRDAAEAYFPTVWFEDDGTSLLQIAALPLPLEDERISLERLSPDAFNRDLTAWITRFNNDGHSRSPYLMAVPGGMGSTFERGRQRFMTTPQHGTSPSEQALIYPTGAFVYWQPLWRHFDPPKFFIDMIKEDARLTLLFINDLYRELSIRPRAIALQVSLRHIEDFLVMVPGRFVQAPNAMKPAAGVKSVLIPEQPLVLSGTVEAMIDRAVPAIDAAIRAHLVPAT